MRRITLNPRDRRALGLLLAVAIPVFLGRFAVMPVLRAVGETRDEVVQARASLTRDRMLVASAGAVDTQRTRTAGWLSNESKRLFDATNDLDATGAFARFVERSAGDAGVRLQHIETRPSTPVTGPLRAVRVDVHATGDVTSMMTFLSGLENGRRLVRVGRLVITHTQGSASPASPPRPVVIAVQPTTDSVAADPPPDSPPVAQLFNRAFRRRVNFGNARPAPAAPVTPVVPPTPPPTPRERPLQLDVTAELYGYALLAPLNGVTTPAHTTGTTYVGLMHAVADTGPDVGDAIAHDPFSASRGRVHVDPSRAAVAAPPPPVVQLVGTVVSGGNSGGFAVCQVGTATPSVLHIGQQIAGYTLRAVRHGGATLTDPAGHDIDLSIQPPKA